MGIPSKKKPTKKSAPAKAAKKPAPKAKKKANAKNRLRVVKETVYATEPATKGSNMNEGQTAPQTAAPSTVEVLLASIEAALKELVQIESYMAQELLKAKAAPAPAPTPAQAATVLQSIPAVAAPAQTAAPASRPGAGTVGGLVWDYCDGLQKQLGRAPTKDEVIAAIKQYSPTLNGQPVNELTASTQYSKWRSAQGLPRLPRGFAAQKPAAVPAPTAPTIGAPPVQPAPLPTAAVAAPLPALPAGQTSLPLPAASVPSVIAPTAVPAPSLPPWLRAQN